jgi:hypothetical protein
MAHGGAAFVQALSRLALIDEYRLVILPVALGNGLPLFKDLARPLRVDLAEAKSFPDGTVIHVYQPITNDQYLIFETTRASPTLPEHRTIPACLPCNAGPAACIIPGSAYLR